MEYLGPHLDWCMWENSRNYFDNVHNLALRIKTAGIDIVKNTSYIASLNLSIFLTAHLKILNNM